MGGEIADGSSAGRLSGVGLGLMALGAGVSVSLFPVSVPLAVVLFVGAVRAWRGRWWAASVTAGALGLFVGLSSGGLALPGSFFDFAPAVLFGSGGLGASVGGIVLRLGVRHGRSSRWWSPAPGAVLSLALVAVASSAFLSFLDRPAVVLPDGRRAVVVEMRADQFSPETLEGAAGAPVVVLVRNRDWYAHTFTVRELGVHVYVGPLAERLVELPGRFGRSALTCEVTGHEAMRGRVFVGRGGS